MKIRPPAYVENKDLKDLFVKFSVLFDLRRVDVFVWKSVRGLRRNTYFKTNDYVGAYVCYPYRKKKSGLFGEIHLVKWMVGAGYVSHEIEHFMIDWLLNHRLTGTESVQALNEPMATLDGEFTKNFWDAWYKIEKRRGK